MELLKDRRYVYSQLLMYFCVAACFIVAAIGYWNYAMIAKSTVPIMDYWRWIAVYGQKTIDGTLTFVDYFNSDFGEHIQPFCMMVNFWVLKASRFDVQPLVEWGIVLRILMAGAFAFVFLFRFRKDQKCNYVLQAVCAVCIILAVLNYNQWELTTEPFSLTNGIRVMTYLLSFYLVDVFLKGLFTRRKKYNFLFAALLGTYCAFLTIFVSGAYFVGHLIAIGLAMLWTLYGQKQAIKQALAPMAVWGGISFIAACVYYFLVKNRGVARSKEETALNVIVLILMGVCYFWGAVIIHTGIMDQYGTALVAIVGVIVLVYAIYITVRYLKSHRDGEGLFPVMCVLYAFVLSVVISIGRVTIFGASSMTASRYVVESTVALCGVVWMTYSEFANTKKSRLGWCKPMACVCSVVLLLMLCAKCEISTAPYRKIYYDNMHDMMLNIENYSDDQLGSFQANSPDDVRYCIEFFKENKLSVFCEPKS